MKTKKNVTRIFIVEDDPIYQRLVKYVMGINPDHEVTVFGSGQALLQRLAEKPDIISLDYSLPDTDGEALLRKIKQLCPEAHVIVLSGQIDVPTAVRMLKMGASDYITKDTETKERLLHTLNSIKSEIHERAEAAQHQPVASAVKSSLGNAILGDSKPMAAVFQLLEKAASTNITVSIVGETGTGKELVAKSIHQNSARRNGPFVAVNMSAIPKELLESELFGYEKGAFTGALARKKGQFEMADGGTLFLDEIGEMDINMQAKLLRVLQERELMRVGGESPIPFDARLVTATNRSLAEEVQRGNFREDLYYRLLGLNITMPPLRERSSDIVLLAAHFLEGFAKLNGLGKIEISKEAKSKLLGYSFPGNVRELRALMELAAVMSTGGVVQADDIRFNSVRKESTFLTDNLTLEEYKTRIINHFLEKYNNDVLLVAKKLDIGKSTIYRMLAENGKQQQIAVGY
ncbi:MAG: sigma-54-dependent Fis family transcriptional regulator [Saprospiraceae bacterium]|nr:sigma-54-dependent Fis family transcriptional regulator [Saprospiraceae bacterium]